MPSPGWRIDERQLGRGFALAGLLAWAASVALALWLVPAPSGLGTHEQLGLGPCAWHRIARLERCPSCGLTTAFALWYRGRWAAAVRVNPLILIGFPVQTMLGGLSLWLWRRPALRSLWWALGLLGGAGAAYALVWLGLFFAARTA